MLQMGMKMQNIQFKTPKINPQSNPNKFGDGKRSKLTWRGLEWWLSAGNECKSCGNVRK